MSTQDSKVIMARNIKRYMERKGVTKQQVCDALGFKYTTFVDWINAVTYPRIGKVEAMAAYFGVQKSDLIEDKPTADEGDGLTANQRKLYEIAKELPDEKVELLLQLVKSMIGAG